MDLDSKFSQHSRLGRERLIRQFGRGRIGHIHMVCAMSRHELIAVNAMKNCIHDGPLRSGFLPAAGRLSCGQVEGSGTANVAMEMAALDEDAAPDDFAGL